MFSLGSIELKNTGTFWFYAMEWTLFIFEELEWPSILKVSENNKKPQTQILVYFEELQTILIILERKSVHSIAQIRMCSYYQLIWLTLIAPSIQKTYERPNQSYYWCKSLIHNTFLRILFILVWLHQSQLYTHFFHIFYFSLCLRLRT